MKKIEKKMIEAIKNRKEFKETNTYVFTTKNGIFVKLYNTIIKYVIYCLQQKY